MNNKVKGLDRLNRQLAALAPSTEAAMAQQLATSSANLAERIKAAAPRSDKEHQHMADTIHAELAASGETATGAKAALGLAWRVVCAAPGRWVEFGTKATPAGRYKDAKGKTRTSSRAHHATRRYPFFWPTVRAWKKPNHSAMVRAGSKAAKAAAATP